MYMVKFNIMKLTKLGIILFSLMVTISACSFEDEIEPFQGQFTVFNDSNGSYDLTITNLDLEGQTSIIETSIDGNTSMNIPLDKGYNYEVNASEKSSGQTQLSVYSTTFTIEAHKDSEWYIPAN